MLEFVFFDPRPRQLFVDFLASEGIAAQQADAVDCLEVAIDENIDDRLLLQVESRYDELMAMDQALFEAGDETSARSSAGVVVKLANGETVYARVNPELLARIMTVLTPTELGDVVNAIVDAVENPDRRGLCRRSP